MKPEEIEAIVAAAAEECMGELDSAPEPIVDPATGLLTPESADAIEATLPPWIRIDRAQPVADDGQIPAIFDLELAALDPTWGAVLGLRVDSDTETP